MTPYRAVAPFDWAALLRLIRAEFAFMDARINPPSSMHRLTEAEIAEKAETGEVWVIGAPLQACVFLTWKPDAVYIGKLAVAAGQRGQGLARALVDVAEARAQATGRHWLELETRVELDENHRAFVAMGFQEVGRKAHAGFDRPTSITFRRRVPA